MIHIQIVQSPDTNILTEFRYFHNQLYVGRSSGELWIQDKDLFASHIMLEVIGKDLLIHPQRGVEFYLLNGKRASAIRKLKINDQVTIGQTIIKVLGFEETIRESKKDVLNKKLNQLIDENSQRLNVVESLTKLMKS